MLETFIPQLLRLPAAQRDLWPTLAPLAHQGFVLHGGTAIALRLGHRDSIDFDFFCDRSLDRTALFAAIPTLRLARPIQDEPNTYTVLAPISGTEVKLSFFGELTFGRIGYPQWTHDRVAIVASLDDLMAQELKVVMQRVEAKDYQDIAALLRHGLRLAEGLAGAETLFGPSFSPTECVKALTYFKGASLISLPKADRDILIDAVRRLPRSFHPVSLLSLSLLP